MKNKINILTSFIILLLCFEGFSQTANIKEGCVPLEILFQAPAGAKTYYWDFKDGVTAKDLPNPKNVFRKAGIYNVTFHDTPTGPVVGTVQIKVFAAPVPKFSFNTGCAPFNVQFKNLTEIDPSIVVKNYVWLFGDQQKQEGQKDVNHVYEKAGKYSVTLNIQADLPSCTVNKLFEDTLLILTPPVATFTTSPATLSSCNENLDVSFTNTSVNTSAITYLWDLGNGKTSADANPPSQKYFSAATDATNKGLYTVLLKVALKDNPACTTIVSKVITVGGPKPKILKKDTVCIKSFADISTAKTGGSYSWSFQGPATKLVSNKDTARVAFLTPGYHKITLKVTSPDAKCSGTTIDSIYVDQVNGHIESDPLFSCKAPVLIKYTGVSNQTDVTYSWKMSDGSLKEGKNTDYSYNRRRDTLFGNAVENVSVYLKIISNKTGCFIMEDSLVVVRLPDARLMPNNTSGCIPLTISFNDVSKSIDKIVSWKWIFGDGQQTVKNDNDPVPHTYTKEGQYYASLIVTTASGCIDTSYKVLIQAGKDISSQIDFTADKNEVCPGEVIKFTTQSSLNFIDGYHFKTEGNRSFHCDQNKDASWSYSRENGLQDVSLIADYNGCLSTKTKPSFINVKGTIAKIDYTSLCSDPLNYKFIDSSKNATGITWDFGDLQSGKSKIEQHKYTTSKDYSIKLTANNGDGCSATTDQITVKVRDLQSKITVDSSICINVPYTFSSAASKDVYADCHTGYTWQFPDISRRPYTTDNTSAKFSFNTPGNHLIRLITKDENGCKDTSTMRLKVYEMKLKAEVDDPLICNPSVVKFSNLSVTDTTQVKWYWNFGDTKDTTVNNPSHTYRSAPPKGIAFNPYLIVFDALGCFDTVKFSIQYYVPATTISATKPNLCLGDTVKISATDFVAGGSHLSYDWDFGNSLLSTSHSEKVYFDSAKSYTVKLKFTEISSGCFGTTTFPINVQDYPQAGFSTNVDTLPFLCAPKNIYFKDTSKSRFPLTYSWNFEEGQALTSPLKDPNYTFKKGEFNTTQTVSTSFGCSATAKRNFKVYLPEADFEMSKDTICRGEEITFKITKYKDVDSYTWAFGDGYTVTKNISDLTPVSHNYNFHPASGKTFARLLARGAGGICPEPYEKDVNIYKVIAEFDRGINGDTTLCSSDGPFPFFNKSVSNTSFRWNFGDGTTSTELNPLHQFSRSGKYNVMLTVANDLLKCRDTIVKPSIIYDIPGTTALGDSVCFGKSLLLKVLYPSIFSTYTWDPGTGLSNIHDTVQKPKLDHTVQYTLTEKDSNNCTTVIHVPGVIIEEIGIKNYDTTIVIGDEISLPIFGPGVYDFRWSPKTGLSCYDCNYPKLRPLEDVEYSLHVSDFLGCFENDYNFKIRLKKETFIKLPSAFTPAEEASDQGPNNYFNVKGWGIKELLEYNIFNRWGQLLYSTTDIHQGWDGKFKGVLQNNDVYVYKVKVLTWRNEVLNSEGYFNLIH